MVKMSALLDEKKQLNVFWEDYSVSLLPLLQ